MPENCLIFKKCCKKIKKKSLQNTSINKNGSNESSKMRYGKAIRGNRQRVGRTTNKCFFKKDEGIFIQKMDYKNNLCNQSILLHELVHALQDFSDNEMNIAFREKEAYEIQNRFLIEKSIEKKLFKTLNLRICRGSQSFKKK